MSSCYNRGYLVVEKYCLFNISVPELFHFDSVFFEYFYNLIQIFPANQFDFFAESLSVASRYAKIVVCINTSGPNFCMYYVIK